MTKAYNCEHTERQSCPAERLVCEACAIQFAMQRDQLRAEVESLKSLANREMTTAQEQARRAQVLELQIRDMTAALKTIEMWAHDQFCDVNDQMIRTKPCNCYCGVARKALGLPD